MNEVKSADMHQCGAIVPGFRYAHPGYGIHFTSPAGEGGKSRRFSIDIGPRIGYQRKISLT
jgi:hypothetical protein